MSMSACVCSSVGGAAHGSHLPPFGVSQLSTMIFFCFSRSSRDGGFVFVSHLPSVTHGSFGGFGSGGQRTNGAMWPFETEPLRRIQLVGAVEEDVDGLVLDRPLPPRHVWPWTQPLVVPGGLQRTGDRHIEGGPHQRLTRWRPVPHGDEVAERISVIETWRLAFHRSRHSSTRANDLLSRHAVHQRCADRRGKVQQTADRPAAAVRLRNFILDARLAGVRIFLHFSVETSEHGLSRCSESHISSSNSRSTSDSSHGGK